LGVEDQAGEMGRVRGVKSESHHALIEQCIPTVTNDHAYTRFPSHKITL
jgi:hypothetical protein